MRRRTALACAAILLLALFVRIATHFELRDYVLYQVPLVDAEDYVAWAQRASSGEAEAADVYYKAPLYPWVLSLAMRLFGRSVDAAYVLNALLGLCFIGLMGLWARRLFGTRIALVACALGAVYAPILYFEAQALPPPLVLLLSVLVLLVLTHGNARPAARWLVIAGVSLGLLVLARPTFILWIPVAALWVGLRARPFAWRRALLVALTASAVVAPVTLRNWVRGGAWVLVSANGGINFYIGNNADAARTSALRPGLEWEELVRRIPAAERRGRARWDRWFARQAWRWVRDEPAQFVKGLANKALQYCNVHEIDRNLDARGFRAHSRVLRTAPRYAWLAPWLLLGMVLAWRRGASGQLAVLFVATSFAATIIFFVSERYKLDAVAATLPLAVAGCAEVITLVRRRATALPVGWIVALVVMAVVLSFPNWRGIRSIRPARAATLEGVALYAQGRNVEAVARLREAIAEDPSDVDAQCQLATALQRLNRYDEALESFERAASLLPGHPKPHAGAGFMLRQLHRPHEALERYNEALRQEPQNAVLLFETAELLESMGRTREAAAHYEAVLRLGADERLAAEARRRLQRLQ